MKVSVITICNVILVACAVVCLYLVYPFDTRLNAATVTQSDALTDVTSQTEELTSNLTALQDDLTEYSLHLDELQGKVDAVKSDNNEILNNLVDFYLERLPDKNYYTIYDDELKYYTAAEGLGSIGKRAIPKLIQRLDTTDDYERSLVLYALLLASQEDDVKEFAGNDYIKTGLDFDASTHPAQVKLAKDWWEKYKGHFS